MGAIGPTGGDFMIKFAKGASQYESQQRNGVTSKSRRGDPAGKSLLFEKVEDQLQLIIDGAFAGMLVDLWEKTTGKWLPGVVSKVIKNSQKDVKLRVEKEGFPPDFAVDVKWPSADVDYCGEKLRDRECDEKSRKPQNKAGFEAKICFTPLDTCPEGFKADNGGVMTKHGSLEYGWGRDMTSMTRERSNQPDPLLKTLIMFPPDPQSLQCKQANPDVSCEPVDWSIKVPVGKYDLKLTVGDAEKKVGYSITVNDQYILTNTELEKNQFQTESISVEATEGIITIRSLCDPVTLPAFCKVVWSRMSAIEIYANIMSESLDDD